MLRKQSQINESIAEVQRTLYEQGHIVKSQKWQGIDSPDNTKELVNVIFNMDMEAVESINNDIRPHAEWVDAHFWERVSGKPLNPGESFKLWPFYKRNPKDDIFRKEEEFSHTYMERIWPKYAGKDHSHLSRKGIRFNYGDLNDLIILLMHDDTTRQAYLPIWFPEDLWAARLDERVPCTLGYDFIIRGGMLYMNYYMRSCDALRHFRDDIALAYLLAKYVRDRVNYKLKLGMLTMVIKSFHCFEMESKSLLSGKF